MENKIYEPTPADLIFERVEKPLGTLPNALELNTKAVELFTEGQLTIDQLIKFSARFAQRADQLTQKILRTDNSQSTMTENKQIAYSSVQDLAAENRKRAIDLTLTRIQKQPIMG